MTRNTNSHSSESRSHQRSERDPARLSGPQQRDIKCQQCRSRFRSQDDLNFHKTTTPYCSRALPIHQADAIHKSRIRNARPAENRSGHASRLHQAENRTASNGSARKRYTCPECQKGFTAKSSLNSHIREYHDESSTYQCPICLLTYPRRSYLRKHTRDVHEADVGYKCNHCQHTTNTKDNVKRHLRRDHMKIPEPRDYSEIRN